MDPIRRRRSAFTDRRGMDIKKKEMKVKIDQRQRNDERKGGDSR